MDDKQKVTLAKETMDTLYSLIKLHNLEYNANNFMALFDAYISGIRYAHEEYKKVNSK